MSTHAVINDIQIDGLIRQAIQTHPIVGSARARQQATTEGINAAKLSLLPTPSISSGYDNDNDFVSQITLRQPLWTGGKLTANVNQALFDDKAAVEFIYEQQNVAAKVTIEAWKAYVQAVAQQDIHIETLKQLNDFEASMQRRVKQGVSARIELDLVTNRILQEQTAYQAQVEQQRISAARLEQIVGEKFGQNIDNSMPDIKILANQAKQQSTNFEQMAFNPVSFYNPTVTKQYFQVESAKQDVKAQQASKYPTVYAQYEQAYYHADSSNEGKFSIGLSYDPGAGFSNLALARASEAQVDSLIQDQEAAQRNVIEDIQVQYQQFVGARDRETSLVAAVAGAEIVVSSYERQFIAGRKSWIEVLNAVRELSDYKVQLVQTRATLLEAFYGLQVDFGVMQWQNFSGNRQSVTLFRPLDPVKKWLNKQNKSIKSKDSQSSSIQSEQSQNFGYTTAVEDDYVEIRLPESEEYRLNKGEFIMLDDNYNITPIVE
ncbi:TolC family protein [Psychrobacter sp. KCTC 72983]|uniref:TolC family protein n=1 Tax=Psychrobacter sp. KCTC 72983 TaxID=2733866 RepID=UPI0016448ADE|nr:TolC family protein [Psychrobacter sp. KCTC 72983]